MCLLELLEREVKKALDGMAMSSRIWWADVPNVHTEQGLLPYQRKCVTCKNIFYGGNTRIECRQCADEPSK